MITDSDAARQELGLPKRVFSDDQIAALQACMEREWQTRAVCGQCGWDAWFLTKAATIPRRLKVVCAGCPVRRSCLASAILIGEDGVWAGTTPKTRRTPTRQIRAGAPVGPVLDQVLAAAQPKPSGGDSETGVAETHDQGLAA